MENIGRYATVSTWPKIDLISENTRVDHVNFIIDYTKVPYSISGPVQLTMKDFIFPEIPYTMQKVNMPQRWFKIQAFSRYRGRCNYGFC